MHLERSCARSVGRDTVSHHLMLNHAILARPDQCVGENISSLPRPVSQAGPAWCGGRDVVSPCR